MAASVDELSQPDGSSRLRRPGPVFRFVRSGLIAYLLVLIVLAFFQRKLMYRPLKSEAIPIAEFDRFVDLYPAASDVELKCADGLTIRGWLLQKVATSATPSAERRPLVIYFHGNAGNRSGRGGWYQLFEQLGVDVLAMDYHGYADSEGEISEQTLQMDCDAVWDFAVNQLRYQPEHIIVVGTSLGGAAAVYLTSSCCRAGQIPGAMVNVATFSSMEDVACRHYPWLPVRLILADRYPSHERIGEVTCPILHFHGDLDRVVDHEFGQKLFEAAPPACRLGVPKQWVNLSNVGHNNLIGEAGDLLHSGMQEFLKQIRRE